MPHSKSNENQPSEKPFTVGLLGASFGTDNYGVAALACGTITSICHTYPNARIILLDYGKNPASYLVNHHEGVTRVELVNVRFSKQLYLSNHIFYLIVMAIFFRVFPISQSRKKSLIQRNRIFKSINEMDLIGSIAGGDSFSDIYGLNRLVYISLIPILILLFEKPLVLLPQTIGPFEGPIAKIIARNILKRAKMILPRDTLSSITVQKLLKGKCNNVKTCYDVGFLLKPQILQERIPKWLTNRNSEFPLIGLNVSGLLYIGGYTRGNMFSLKIDYRQLIYHLILHFLNNRTAQIMLVPHVFGEGKDSESDLYACREIFHKLSPQQRPRVHVLDAEYDQYEMKALIGKCDFFIGSRMHACIASLSQCIPAVGLAYSQKFRGVFASIGMEMQVIDLREKDEQSIIKQLDLIFEKRFDLKERLQFEMPNIKTTILNMFSDFL
jgi:polysaccharide pyruvyl transferase WcaK-like protein